VAKSLRKALRYQPKHVVARHRLGVALSRDGNFDDGIAIFNKLIDEELSRPTGPTDSLAYAYKAKMGTLKRAGRYAESIATHQEARRELSKHAHTEHLVASLSD